MSERWTETEMLELAARGVGKVDAGGRRGIERVTHDEIAAMAATLACLGVVPIPPGGAVPARLYVPQEKGERA